ncbi:MAG: glucokinase [Gemmatimonadales bacterium]
MTASLDHTRPAATPPVGSRAPGLLLAGDIGGTKTALGIFSSARGPREPVVEAEFPSAKYASLAELVREFLAKAGVTVQYACFDVAGPVLAGRARITNLPWVLAEDELAAELRLRSVLLLNDLEAAALATSVLEPDDLHTLNAGEPLAGGALAVIAPGTGLGEAFLTWDGTRHRAFPSEGGHADFAPTDELQAALHAHLMQRFGHVSVERVCSGPGLLNIYQYLRESGHAPESAVVARRLAAGEDGPPIIGEAAERRPDPDPLSRAAVQLFVSILGAEAGNLALKVLSTGGVYLAGGIPARMIAALGEGRFMRAFVAKGRLGDMLARMPVHVVLRRAALLGAALRGLERAAAPTD